jgi:hypothetical protein
LYKTARSGRVAKISCKLQIFYATVSVAPGPPSLHGHVRENTPIACCSSRLSRFHQTIIFLRGIISIVESMVDTMSSCRRDIAPSFQ